ncbi:hypothetical protein [Polyangium aurulentum]|uniref:hypothetical protein n=1 Tax=Polyangium aurulentum TaxID=2567896 RepID=UPI0010ADEF4B|nr:hypothetical protein [Polyangium aurulentum]UQA54758.1 hypothetical protein E8A73_025655 [Polyangium aurulentum]
MHRAHLVLLGSLLLAVPACASDTPVLARACPPSGVDEFGVPCFDAPPDPCGGACVPKPPAEAGWSEPVLVWKGPRDEAPLCPEVAPTVAWEGYDRLTVEPFQCAECRCDPPETQCDIPNLWTAYTAIHCAGAETPFYAGNDWGGECTYIWAIAPEKMCGNLPCVASLGIEPPRVPSKICASRTDGPDLMPTPVTDLVMACKEQAPRSCIDRPDLSCQAFAPEGFVSCIYHEGFAACPEGWPDREDYLTDYDDGRTCSECFCKPSTGAVCTVQVTAYKNFTCLDSLGSLVLEIDEPGCLGVPTGTRLGSKEVEILEYHPGACQPYGGLPYGTVTPGGAYSFCCRKWQ